MPGSCTLWSVQILPERFPRCWMASLRSASKSRYSGNPALFLLMVLLSLMRSAILMNWVYRFAIIIYGVGRLFTAPALIAFRCIITGVPFFAIILLNTDIHFSCNEDGPRRFRTYLLQLFHRNA